MTNHLNEQAGAEMAQNDSQLTGDIQNVENQSAVLEQTDNHPPVLVEEQDVKTVVESGRADIEDETPDVAIDEAVVEVETIDVEVIPLHDMTEPAAEDDFDAYHTSDSVGKAEADYADLTRKEIVERLRQLLDKGDVDALRNEIEVIKFQFYRKLKAEEELKRAEYIENGGAEDTYIYEEDAQELILKSLMNRYREIRNVQNEKLEAEKQKNLEEKLKIIEELKELTGSTESIGKTFELFRNLQARWRTIGTVPQAEVKNLWDTYHHYVEMFYDYVKLDREMREIDFKRNLEAKIKLCEKTEALLLEPSMVSAFRTLQTLHEQWREIGPVSQEMRVEIWERFKAASTQVNKKHQEHFENLKETYRKNREAKEALCEKVEEIIARHTSNSSNQWRKNAQEIVEIQKLWNTIGYAGKKEGNKVFKRFHVLCDSYFKQMRMFAGHEKEEQQNNLQMKQDLCVQAEALKESSEWNATTDEFIQLQKKWKEIGNVPIKQRDHIWKRFRAACDYFFEQKAKYQASIDSKYDDNLKAKQTLLEHIKNFVPSEKTEDSFERLKELQRQWSDIGFVPVKYKKRLQEEYRQAINQQFDALRLNDGQRNRLNYKSRVDAMSSEPKSYSKLSTERSKLVNKHMKIQSDLLVWENNIGFFTKSKKSDAMTANVRRMIEEGKAELKDLEEKIRIIDSMKDEHN